MHGCEGETMTTRAEELVEFVAVCRYRLAKNGAPPRCVAFHPADWPSVSLEVRAWVASNGWHVWGEPVAQFCGLPVLVDHRVPRGIIHVGQKPLC